MSENPPHGDTSSPREDNNDNHVATMLPINIPYELRNAEAIHNAMLQEAKEYHDTLRHQAEQFLMNHLLEERLKGIKLSKEQEAETYRLQRDIYTEEKEIADMARSVSEAKLAKEEAERKRIEAEAQVRDAEIQRRKAENATKLLPQIPPRVKTPPPAAIPPSTQQPGPKPTAELSASQSATQPSPSGQAQSTTPNQPPPNPFAKAKITSSSLAVAQGQSFSTTPAAPQNAPPPAAQAIPTPHAAAPAQNSSPMQAPPRGLTDLVDLPESQRYVEIHLQLKTLRKQVKPKGKENVSPLKEVAMKQSAAIRIAMGQLSIAGKNQPTFNKLRDIMKESLEYQVNIGNGSQILMMDPSPYVLRTPAPLSDPAAKNNGPQLPVLFIYLLSVFSKALVAQAAQEAAQKPESAEPIALAAHQIFSHPDLLWRGMSMIDILIAKIRKSCGTLFGFRGAENTDSGRVTLGWKKEDGNWISEAFHYDRMRGIGSFYAGLTLRIYKNRVNPYPPHHYWRAMAAILSCPQQERTNTSYYVLCSLIQGYEQKFFQFYGDMAVAALEAALIHYPLGSREKSVAVMTLLTLGEKLQKEGLHLPAE